MIDFSTAISQGEVAAQNVSNNFKEVDFVFQLLNNELSKKGFKIDRIVKKNPISVQEILTPSSLSHEVDEFNKDKTGILCISLCDNQKASKAIGTWKQSLDGYPFTLEYLMERTDCWDKEALISKLTSIISSGQFWLKVKELKASNI